MNLIVLLASYRAWQGPPLAAVTRVFAAISTLSIELQLATWTGWATLKTLVAFNIGLGLVALLVTHTRDPRGPATEVSLPWPVAAAAASVALLVVLLNVSMPPSAADPYHLERVTRIAQTGTLAYDPTLDPQDPRVNVLGWLYEALLADLSLAPLIGDRLLQLHGVWALALYTLTVSAVFTLFSTPVHWWMALVFAVPVVFQQFVLIKNDLFGGVPVALVLAWLVARSDTARLVEYAWAGWLTTLALGIKLTNFPLAVVFGGFLLLKKRTPQHLGAAALGCAAGMLAGGLLFTTLETTRVYGSPTAPLSVLGNTTTGLAESAVSTIRFAISLADLGLVTRHIWPGRGNWGGTFGLPLLWALFVSAACWRRDATARAALSTAALFWLLAAVTYPDADIAHRYTLGAAVVLLAAAVTAARRQAPARWITVSAGLVLFLSALQIIRSAMLYLTRS